MKKLLLATRNRGKMGELTELLCSVPFELVSLEDMNILEEVDETGATFQENAIIKAREYAHLSGLLTLSDDSGLEVDALSGAPGVISARYGLPTFSDEDRVQFLLSNLRSVPWEKRTARFRCVIAIAKPSGDVNTVEGVVEGIIQYKTEGLGGFGYDPVFHIPGRGCTTAQLTMDEKNTISHRGQAAEKAAEFLRSELTWEW